MFLYHQLLLSMIIFFVAMQLIHISFTLLSKRKAMGLTFTLLMLYCAVIMVDDTKYHIYC
jgi:hypothetical protein